jgi:hypothetical protein
MGICEDVEVVLFQTGGNLPEDFDSYDHLIVHIRECERCGPRAEQMIPAVFSGEGSEAIVARYANDWSQYIDRAKFYYHDLLRRGLVRLAWTKAEEGFCSLLSAVTNTLNYVFVSNKLSGEAVFQRSGRSMWLKEIGPGKRPIEVTESNFVSRARQYREGLDDPREVERLVAQILDDLCSERRPDILEGFVARPGLEPGQVRLLREPISR